MSDRTLGDLTEIADASLQPAVIWSILEKELPSLRRAVARLAAGLRT